MTRAAHDARARSADMIGQARRIAVALAVAGVVAAGGVVAGQQTQQPVFRGGVSLVTVDAYPQRNGEIVPDLTAADFQVFEDGKPQKVETFSFVRIEPGPQPGDAPRTDPSSVRESLALAADPRNRVFVLYLDVYHVTIAGSHDIRQPLTDMLDRLLAAQDLFGVMTPYARPRDLALGRKTDSIEDQLARNWPWGQRDSIARDPADEEIEQCFAMTPGAGTPWIVNDGPAQRRLADIMVARRREDATLSHLEQFVRYLGSIREARKAVLLLSPGWVLYNRDDALLGQISRQLPGASRPSNPASSLGGLINKYEPQTRCDQVAMHLLSIDDQQRLRDLMTESNRNNVTFYPVSPSGLQAFDTPINQVLGANLSAPLNQSVSGQEMSRVRDRTASARTLAENTDGIAIVDTNDIRIGFRRVVDDVSAYYLLGYYSTNAKVDNKYRRIEVKVNRPGVTVKARRGYVASALPAAPESEASGGASGGEGPAPVDAALAELPRIDRSSEILIDGATLGGDLAVVAEIAGTQMAGGGFAQGATVQVVVTGRGGAAMAPVDARIEPGQRSALVRVPVGAAPGPWQVLVKADGAGGALTARGEIAPSTGALLGRPLMFRATPAARSPLRPVADRQFRRAERVHLEWPVLAEMDARSARLLDRRGQPLPIGVTVSERDAGNGPSLVADLNLAPLAPGDYVIEVTAGRGTDVERQFVAFRIVP